MAEGAIAHKELSSFVFCSPNVNPQKIDISSRLSTLRGNPVQMAGFGKEPPDEVGNNFPVNCVFS